MLSVAVMADKVPRSLSTFRSMLKRALFGIIALGVIVALLQLPTIHTLDLKSLDLLHRDHVPHPDIAIIAIDTASLQSIGRWPWDRSIHAQLIEKLNTFHPRVVGYDVAFSEQQNPTNDTALATALRSASYPIVLPIEPLRYAGSPKIKDIVNPLSIFTNSQNVHTGLVSAVNDADGYVRQLTPPLQLATSTINSFADVLARTVDARIPTGDHQDIDFAGPAGTFPTYSFNQVLAGQVPAENLQNKIIFVGATASDLHDTIPVPIGNQLMAGVEWHANALDSILLQRSIIVLSSSVVAVLNLLLTLIIFFLFILLPPRKVILLTIGLCILMPVASFALLHNHIALPWISPIIAIVAIFVYESLVRWYYAEKERRKLKRTIQNYFSPAVVAEILRNPKLLSLGGERREVTIFFSDIRSFTTITETVSPEILSRILHEYFTEMTAEILATDGVVDKFIGDAIMAFWGAPLSQADHAERAVKTAIAMMERLQKLQHTWEKEKLPFIDIGIGINTGFATVGNMGSSQRFDYTVIGDSVNVAARLESLNKEHHTHIIISESTKDKLPATIKTNSLGSVTVKGKAKAIDIFEVMSDKHDR